MNTNERFRILTKSNDKQRKIRISSEMLNLIEEMAKKNGRTVNSEILYRVVQTLTDELRSIS